MIEWRDTGFVIAMRHHGESSAILEVFTRAHGRHVGIVRGGASRKMAANLQPGTDLHLEWRARLDDHIGTFVVEPHRSLAHLLSDRLALTGLLSACALLRVALPEREPHPELWLVTHEMLDALGAADWTKVYVRWELRLLEELGFGLDLSECAVTGETEGLAFVSPKTGRAVTQAGAGEWADRLLPLPSGLHGNAPLAHADVLTGLALTGFFLDRGLRPILHERPLPEARARLIDLLARSV